MSVFLIWLISKQSELFLISMPPTLLSIYIIFFFLILTFIFNFEIKKNLNFLNFFIFFIFVQ